MGRSQESYNKKEVRKNKEQKRKDKEKRRQARKETERKSGFNDMIAYVDLNGNITSTPPDPGNKNDTKLEDIEVSIPRKSPGQESDKLRTGTVTFYNESKGYGFIKDSETGQSIFVHVNNLLEGIKEGNRVNFEQAPGQKGPTAVKVKLQK